MWTAVGQAFSMVFEPYTLMVMVLAAFYGLFVGAVPGLTATMATALLVPVTFFKHISAATPCRLQRGSPKLRFPTAPAASAVVRRASRAAWQAGSGRQALRRAA